MSNRHFAVIGDPIAHSLSPLLHQTAFDLTGNPVNEDLGTYVAYQVKKEDLSQFMNMFCGRKSTRVFRPLCLLKEGENYADGLWECDPTCLNSPLNSSGDLDTLGSQQSIPMVGISVTLPHKKDIMQYANRVTPLAALVGAANTLYWENGSELGKCRELVAHNTDVEGFLSPLYAEYAIREEGIVEDAIREHVTIEDASDNSIHCEGFVSHVNVVHRNDGKKQTAMILGAGGAAAAVLVGLLHIPCMEKIYVCARNTEQSKKLCEHIKKIAQESSLSERLTKVIFTIPEALPFNEKNKKVDLVVNTIPATLNGQSFNPRDCFKGVSIAYDLLYAHTPFLQSAKEQGAHIINGGEMFLQQGARQFKLWTGKDMPQKALDTVQKSIEQRS